MAQLEGVDYSWARPDPAKLKAAGKHFVVRYLSYDTSGKNLDAAEVKALHAAGVAVVANWENAAGDAKGGFATGQTYAREARAQVRALGIPDDRPIYFSVDFDMNDNDAVKVAEYFRGIATVLPLARIGVYGGYNTMHWAISHKWASWFWQTYAWSRDRWHSGVHIQQYHNGANVAGGTVDLNRAMTDDYGAWGLDDVSAKDVWTYDVDPSGKSAYTAAGATWAMLARTDTLANSFAPKVSAALASLDTRLSLVNTAMVSLNLRVGDLATKLDAAPPPPVIVAPVPDNVALAGKLDAVMTRLDQSTSDVAALAAKLNDVVVATSQASPAYQLRGLTTAVKVFIALGLALMVFAAIVVVVG